MKKHLLAGLAIILAIPTYAQLQKGTRYVGGTISFRGSGGKYEGINYPESGKTRLNIISPELQYGYFVNKSTMIGLGLKYNVQFFRAISNSGLQKDFDVDQIVQLLPFIRRYIRLSDRWHIFVHGEVGSGYHWFRGETTGSMTNTNRDHFWQHNVSIKPGVTYVFTKSAWSIEGYTNFLSLNAQYVPYKSGRLHDFTASSGISTDFPSYFTIRVAKYL
jgi:hypothetical protein